MTTKFTSQRDTAKFILRNIVFLAFFSPLFFDGKHSNAQLVTTLEVTSGPTVLDEGDSVIIGHEFNIRTTSGQRFRQRNIGRDGRIQFDGDDEILFNVQPGVTTFTIGGSFNFSPDDDGTFLLTAFGSVLLENSSGVFLGDFPFNATPVPIVVRNVAPNITSISDDATVFAGDAINYFANATDPGNDPLEYDWDFDGDGNFDASGSSGTTSISVPGVYDFEVRVSDGDGGEAFEEVTFTVLPLIEYSAGRIEITQDWQTVIFDSPMQDPVPIMSIPSFNGIDPGTVRIRNVTNLGFEVSFYEFNYLNGQHLPESVGYFVVEAGTHTLPNGGMLVAGASSITHDFSQVSLPTGFLEPPVIIAQVGTLNGADAVTTRVRNVSNAGFQLRLQEEEAANQIHTSETVYWIGIEEGRNPGFPLRFESGSTGPIVGHELHNLNLLQTYTEPHIVFGQAQTFNGPDPFSIRGFSINSTNFDIFLHEETSLDNETAHNLQEDVGYFVIEVSGN